MARVDSIVGLDIGSTKVTAIVGSLGPDGRMQIVGYGSVRSAGIRRGSVIDIENTVRSIEEAIEKAEQMSGREIDGGFVSITGPSIASINNRGVVAVADSEQEISRDDVERVLQAARVIALPHDRRVIHVIARQFIVDGVDSILDPVGMVGARLEVETQIVTIASAAAQNLLKCCERAGFHVQELVLAPLASGDAVLFPAEKDLGVVVDIGGGTTDVAIFDQGSLWYSAMLPVGGDYITSDLAVGLRTPITVAEELKRNMGSVLPDLMSDSEMVNITGVGGQDVRQVSKKMIASIVQPRVQEIFALVNNQLEKSRYQGLLPGGIVLTGGAALTEGMVEFAEEVMQRPVRLGFPEAVGGLADVIHSPVFATGIGLLSHAARRHATEVEKSEGFSLKEIREIIERIIRWFKDLF